MNPFRILLGALLYQLGYWLRCRGLERATFRMIGGDYEAVQLERTRRGRAA